MDNNILILATVAGWCAMTHAKGFYEQKLHRLAHYLYGFYPTSQRNLFRSKRRNSFVTTSEVRSAERTILFTVQWIVIPAITVLPWYWYFLGQQAG